MKKTIIAASLPVVIILTLSCIHSAFPVDAAKDSSPKEWAQPVQKPGLPNLNKVSESLYRGAQPSKEGFIELKNLGIKTVVNLRLNHSDKALLGDTGLQYFHIKADAGGPKYQQAVEFLKIAADPKNQPVFVHCQHGADRTGTMVAIYRMAVLGWSKEKAIKEMVEGGFGYHSVWSTKILPFLKSIDIEKLKKDAGLK